MKKSLIPLVAGLGLAPTANAQFSNFNTEFLLGGGYLEDADNAYGFAQLRAKFYEDQNFSHTAFIEFLGHSDDVVLEFPVFGGGSFLEDGDIKYANVTLNYELETKLGGPFSFYVGGGAGVEIVSIDDAFDISLDSDTSFVAQVFAGLQADFGDFLMGQVGARYLFREDFSLLGDQYSTNDSWAFEASVGFRF